MGVSMCIRSAKDTRYTRADTSLLDLRASKSLCCLLFVGMCAFVAGKMYRYPLCFSFSSFFIIGSLMAGGLFSAGFIPLLKKKNDILPYLALFALSSQSGQR